MIYTSDLYYKKSRDEEDMIFEMQLNLNAVHHISLVNFNKEEEHSGRLEEYANKHLTRMIEKKLYGHLIRPTHELELLSACYLPPYEAQLAHKLMEEIREGMEIQ